MCTLTKSPATKPLTRALLPCVCVCMCVCMLLNRLTQTHICTRCRRRFVNVSPHPADVGESLSSLRFAEKVHGARVLAHSHGSRCHGAPQLCETNNGESLTLLMCLRLCAHASVCPCAGERNGDRQSVASSVCVESVDVINTTEKTAMRKETLRNRRPPLQYERIEGAARACVCVCVCACVCVRRWWQ